MTKTIETPVELIEGMVELRFPSRTNDRMQKLMDRANEGQLTPEEGEELEVLVELSEIMGVLRGQALLLLGRSPK